MTEFEYNDLYDKDHHAPELFMLDALNSMNEYFKPAGKWFYDATAHGSIFTCYLDQKITKGAARLSRSDAMFIAGFPNLRWFEFTTDVLSFGVTIKDETKD